MNMNTAQPTNSAQNVVEDAELEALVSALEAKWLAEREARDASKQ